MNTDIRTEEAKAKGLKAKIQIKAKELKYGYKTAFHTSNSRWLTKEQNFAHLQSLHGAIEVIL